MKLLSLASHEAWNFSWVVRKWPHLLRVFSDNLNSTQVTVLYCLISQGAYQELWEIIRLPDFHTISSGNLNSSVTDGPLYIKHVAVLTSSIQKDQNFLISPIWILTLYTFKNSYVHPLCQAILLWSCQNHFMEFQVVVFTLFLAGPSQVR